MAGYGIRYGVVVIQSAAALLRRYNVRTVTVHGNMEMIRHECPWCERIFTLEYGRYTYTVDGKILICNTCYDTHMTLAETGAWVDAGPALQQMIDSGFLVEWKPEPGELDKPVAALKEHIDSLILDQLLKEKDDEEVNRKK